MKDKKQAGEELKKENIFYYEAIGFFSILLSIIIVAKLGKIGKVLTILFKVSFGDWYLLIVFLIFIYGLYLVIQHRPFEFQNQKFIGYIICCIGLFILAHFSVHKYVLSSSGSYFKATWMYYKTFIQTGNDTYLGGGIIGGIIFYLIYSLLGSIGVLLISLFIVILGFTMIINKSLVDISHFFYKKIKNAKKYGKSFKRFFKYELGNNNYNKNQLSIYEKKKNLSLKLLDDYKNYSLFEEQGKRLIEQKSLIISIFHHYSLQYKEEKNNIGYSASLFIFHIYSSFDCQLIGNKLNDLLDEMVYLSRKNQKLQIEINHNNPMILSIKSLLMKQSVMKNNYLLPVGITIDNELEEIDYAKDGSFMIVGDEKTGIKTFIISLMIEIFYKLSYNECLFYLFDETLEFNHYYLLFYQIINEDLKEYLNKIVHEIDHRLNLIRQVNVTNIDEYNMECEVNHEYKKFSRNTIVFSLKDETVVMNQRFIEDKITYIVQVGKIVGINAFVINRYPLSYSQTFYNIFNNKFVFHLNDPKNSKYVLNNNHACVLALYGEAIYQKDIKQIRMQLPYISKEEVNKITK